jgi:hypothetical protein
VEKIRFSTHPSPSPNTHLHLLLQVPAVILNAVKEPEEFHSPQQFKPFHPNLPQLPLSPHYQKPVISTEATDSLIVRRAVEKSASPPHPSPSPHTRLHLPLLIP